MWEPLGAPPVGRLGQTGQPMLVERGSKTPWQENPLKKEKRLYLGNAASNFGVAAEFMRKVADTSQCGRVRLPCVAVALV